MTTPIKMTEEEFFAFIQQSYTVLVAKQESLKKTYDLGRFKAYELDEEKRLLRFQDGDSALELPIIIAGSWSETDGEWLWGWADEGVSHSLRAESERLKQLHARTGYSIFSNPCLKADLNTAYELVAMALQHLNGRGIYRAVGDSCDLFLVLI